MKRIALSLAAAAAAGALLAGAAPASTTVYRNGSQAGDRLGNTLSSQAKTPTYFKFHVVVKVKNGMATQIDQHPEKLFFKTVVTYDYVAAFDFLNVPSQGSFSIEQESPLENAFANWTMHSDGGTDESGVPSNACDLKAEEEAVHIPGFLGRSGDTVLLGMRNSPPLAWDSRKGSGQLLCALGATAVFPEELFRGIYPGPNGTPLPPGDMVFSFPGKALTYPATLDGYPVRYQVPLSYPDNPYFYTLDLPANTPPANPGISDTSVNNRADVTIESTPYCRVPNIVKEEWGHASVDLTAAACRLGHFDFIYSATVKKDYVISQSRKAGTVIRADVFVDFKVSKGPKPKRKK